MKFLQADFLAVAQIFTSPFLSFPTSENFIRNILAKSVAASSPLIIVCLLDRGGWILFSLLQKDNQNIKINPLFMI